MIMTVVRVESTNLSGISKTGKPYHIDNTMVTVEVPFDNAEGFGMKEMTYQFGDSSNYERVKSFRGKLPLQCEIALGATLNSYGNVETAITDIKMVAGLNKVGQ